MSTHFVISSGYILRLNGYTSLRDYDPIMSKFGFINRI